MVIDWSPCTPPHSPALFISLFWLFFRVGQIPSLLLEIKETPPLGIFRKPAIHLFVLPNYFFFSPKASFCLWFHYCSGTTKRGEVSSESSPARPPAQFHPHPLHALSWLLGGMHGLWKTVSQSGSSDQVWMALSFSPHWKPQVYVCVSFSTVSQVCEP